MAAAGNTAPRKGVAGRIDYDSWEKRTSDLTKQLDDEEELEKKESASALGLDGRHARSKAEAEEQAKAKEAEKTKKVLDSYQRRESAVMAQLDGLLGPVNDDTVASEEEKHQETKYITREMLDAGKRVVSITNTSGPGKIVLTQDLSNLESVTPANSTLEPKSYQDDAENELPMPQDTTHRGIIKLILQNLHKCTVIVKCKIITGTIEISHCKEITVMICGDDATVPTIQADLCTNLDIQYHDAPSGKNVPLRVRDTNSGPTTTLFWGQDKDDRIYHAGVSGLHVSTYRDGFVDIETRADYLENGAKSVGNSTAEEAQFITSVVDNELVTERIYRPGESTNVKKGMMPLTERELKVMNEQKKKIDEAIENHLNDAIKIDGGRVETKTPDKKVVEEVIEEVFTSSSKEDIETIVTSCENEKAKGNEAFTSGEYAQAVLFYTLALDRAAELPDATTVEEKLSGKNTDPITQLFPRHIVLSNRSACFLKLGHHKKALKDGTDSESLDGTYVKGIFRKGLALHAMGRYKDAIEALAAAHKLEPKNKQIKQALQFAEVRMYQEMQKRMDT
jgi:tetratricopeptide (TPR) repeat protein